MFKAFSSSKPLSYTKQNPICQGLPEVFDLTLFCVGFLGTNETEKIKWNLSHPATRCCNEVIIPSFDFYDSIKLNFQSFNVHESAKNPMKVLKERRRRRLAKFNIFNIFLIFHHSLAFQKEWKIIFTRSQIALFRHEKSS